MCQSAEEALHLFGSTRTRNGKGVTIPRCAAAATPPRIRDHFGLMPRITCHVAATARSQMRYVHYYEQLLRRGTIQVPTYQITHVRFIGVPNFDVVRARGRRGVRGCVRSGGSGPPSVARLAPDPACRCAPQGGGCDPYFVVDCMWAEQREDGQWVKSLPKEPVWDYKRHQRKQHVRAAARAPPPPPAAAFIAAATQGARVGSVTRVG